MTRRLLILSCSARKRDDSVLLPAIDRYDGPLWRVVRGYLRENPTTTDLDIFALSAVYGLIPSNQPIPWYEQKMTLKQTDVLQPTVMKLFQTLMIEGAYQKVCLAISQLYWQAMRGWDEFVSSAVMVTLADGPQGTKQAQVRAWLHGKRWEPLAERPTRIAAAVHARGITTLCGITIQMSREAVFEKARQFINKNHHATGRYRYWYVMVDGQPVSAKGLVSYISGIPTKRFDTGRARAVLLALGVSVERKT